MNGSGSALVRSLARACSTGWLAVILWSAVAWIVVPLLFGSQGVGDRERYLAMAATPFEFTVSPWGYRIAIPWAARALEEMSPLTRAGAFEVLQFIAFAGCNLLIAGFSQAVRLPPWLAALALAAFATGYQFVYYRHNYTHVGIYELLFLGWCCMLCHERKSSRLVIVLALSVLVKESIAFLFLQVFVLHVMLEYLLSKGRAWRSSDIASVVIAPLFVFAIMRLTFGAESEVPTQAYLDGYDDVLFRKIFDNFSWRVVEFLTVYGVLLFAIPFALWRSVHDSFLRLHLLVVIVALDQLLLAVDARRMAAVAMISLIVMTLRLASRHFPVPFVGALLALQFLFGLGWMSQRYTLAIVALAGGATLSGWMAWTLVRRRADASDLPIGS